MLGINAEFTLRSGKGHHVYVFGINFFLGRNDFQFQSSHSFRFNGLTVYCSNASTFLDRINVTFHVEILLGHIVVLAIQNFFETAHGLSSWHVLSFVTGKDFSHMKWLAKEPLNLACALNSDLVLRA